MRLIDAEPIRHGHWIKVDEEYVRCSLCGCVHLKPHYKEFYGYCCRHCGAKMKEVEE